MGSCQEAGWSKSETRQCQSTAFKEKVRFAHPVDKNAGDPTTIWSVDVVQVHCCCGELVLIEAPSSSANILTT